MAIHRTVLTTADRRWRIEADQQGALIRITRDNELIATVDSMPVLLRVLADYGIEPEDLIEG